MPSYLHVFALVGVVLTLSALASGLVERAPISFPILFLSLGVLLGEHGLGLIAIGPHDSTLEIVALVSLAFVLFLDAMKMRPAELSKGWFVPMLILGPGTLLTIFFVALAAWLLLGTGPVPSLLLGAILASTDPVVLRDVLRNPRLPRSVRQTLSVEAGTNDLVVLPIVLVLLAIAKGRAGGAGEWLLFLTQIFVLSPLIGFAIGGVGAALMARIDAKMDIRREHQALYGVGLVLVAYVAGVAVGGDGFLAAFAAGAATVVLDYELCDCFLEYGETTAEMAMLLAFILFGALLSKLVTTVPLLPSLLLAALTIGIARPLAINLVLHRAELSRTARCFIGWFGPRGLSSLLLALLAVQQAIPDAERLLAVTGVVVIVSVVLHGATATPFAAAYAAKVARETLPEERESTAAGLLGEKGEHVRCISPAELAAQLAGPDPPLVLDVRSRSQSSADHQQIPGSIRVFPDRVTEWAAEQPRERAIVTYCT